MENLNQKEIIQDYLNGMGAEKIALKYHIGKLKVNAILDENGIPRKKRGGQKLKIDYVVPDWRIDKYPPKEGYHYVAIFREDGTRFNDHQNQGGFLTSYISEKVGIEIPTLYDRRKYYMTTGNYWWEQWFDIVLEEDKPVKKCPYCNWETVDIDNRSGAFEVHLRETHNMSVEDYLKSYPDDLDYFTVYKKCQEKKATLQEEHNFVVCPLCGEHLTKITAWHLKHKHNLSTTEFKKLFPNAKMISDNLHDIFMRNREQLNLKVSKKRFVSCYEQELGDWLTNNGIKFEPSRQILIGKEIDILIHEKKIGIEFNGLKWHTERFGRKDRNYHVDKTNKCLEKGYSLIHIFEDEYVKKKDIVYSKLSHILGLDANKPKIYARKCTIKEILKYQSDAFLEKNHIQGAVSASVYLGAFNGNKLVGVMLFKNGNMKNPNWELVRFATDNSKVCCGLGGKMFSYFVKKYYPTIIVSFADRRWTTNMNDNLYTKLGFKLEKITSPDYRYYNEKIDPFGRIHKMQMNKKTLSKKYGFSPNMTEAEMAKALGYDRIWDCGLIKYVWKHPLIQQ